MAAAHTLAVALAVFSVVLFVLNGELLQHLHTGGEASVSPLINVWACQISGVVLLPWAGKGYTKVRESMSFFRFAVCVGILAATMISYNLAWVLASEAMPLAVLNGLFQTSVGTTYLASVFLLRGESFSPRKTAGAGLGVLGALVISHAGGASAGQLLGFAYAGLAILGNTLYQVLFKKWFGQAADADVAVLFLASISAANLLAGAPALAVWGPGPVADVKGVAITAVLAYVVQGMWVAVMMLGSPLLLPCAMGLTIPVSVVTDFFFHGDTVTPVEGMGHILLLASFFVVVVNPPSAKRWVLEEGLPYVRMED
mmetsp:Transcript_58992/g.133412  ORF Transcript_58992/g.133412 Transcript_58992/m.133412 type:complete len:313 (+) Transcript_58992:56-994(+)